MTKSLNVKFENGVRFLVQHFPPSYESSRKPVLFHDIRVGVYLYNHGYSEDVVLAGLLHDAIEWSSATEDMVRDEFGEKILKLILANTKDDTIEDKHKKTAELIQRCVKNGQDALIIKTADILDSFKWYASQDSIEQLKYCMRNANAIFKYKESDFVDPIFDELKSWKEKFEHLSE
ncbi:MAG: HD domain-containing protein [Candidatus Omnitrophica bacterium]|nr:HD domain-containing protein [Candidatus Omnitrophota bacterium]